MTRFRLFRVVGLALSLSLVAAACGDDDDTTTDASAETEETTASEETTEEMSEDMGDESAAPASSAEACDADAIVAAVEEGSNEEGTLAGMTDDPVGTAASNNPVLTTLVTAVSEAGLGDTLNSAEALTVFAPTDCAFAALDPATLEAALADPSGLLTTVLGFHVIPERLSPEDLAGMTELTTFTGEVLEISAEGETLSLGGGQANVVVPDIQTANATVYLIDAVMLPPSAG